MLDAQRTLSYTKPHLGNEGGMEEEGGGRRGRRRREKKESYKGCGLLVLVEACIVHAIKERLHRHELIISISSLSNHILI